MRQKLRLFGKKILFPGLDLHTRCRRRFLAPLIQGGAIDTLDAGFGNGALSLIAYDRGSRVLGVSIARREVEDTQALLDSLNIPPDRFEVREMNIYDLETLDRRFDQIICSETLEHITRDAEVVKMFARLLRPQGTLLLCCPNALHPENALGRTDEPETGYHVRDGYTLDSYRTLLEPAGLRIVQQLGIGSPLLCRLDKILREVRRLVGDVVSLPLFLLFLPLTWLDFTDPETPFSLAVLAEKQSDSENAS